MRKIKFCWLLIVGIAALLSSCLGDDDSSIDDSDYANALISSFSLSSDSITGLSDVVFTIDQLNGLIFNKDSMPYGTVIDEKVICSMKCEVGPYAILMVETATNDSSYWDMSDSVDLSAPVIFKIYPYDGTSTKTYVAKINIHKVDPDSMVWCKYSDLISSKSYTDMQVIAYDDTYYLYAMEGADYELYKSNTSDMQAWSKLSLSGFPSTAIVSQLTEYEDSLYVPDTTGKLYSSVDGQVWTVVDGAPSIVSLLGALPFSTTNRASMLSAVKKDGSIYRFVSMNKNMGWVDGSEIPSTFPITGFCKLNYEARYYPRLVIAGGRDQNGDLTNHVWATMNGLSWASLTNSDTLNTFAPREGAALSYYDDCFYLVGGFDSLGVALKDIYCSKDQGLTWSDTINAALPEDYVARGGSSVVVDNDNFMWLFGGKASKNTNVLNELWRGRINRLGFKDD